MLKIVSIFDRIENILRVIIQIIDTICIVELTSEDRPSTSCLISYQIRLYYPLYCHCELREAKQSLAYLAIAEHSEQSRIIANKGDD